VVINEELTAEEWKRRYEKERDKVSQLRGILQKMEFELKRWRCGEKIQETEWSSLSVNSQLTDSGISFCLGLS
jgi:kinesin family protein 5